MAYYFKDIVSNAWIGDSKVLREYIDAKRAHKQRPTPLTKLRRKETGSRLKPSLVTLKARITKEENADAINKLARSGVLPLGATPQSKVIMAIEQMIRQLE